MTIDAVLIALGIIAGFFATMFENPNTGYLAPVGITLLWVAFILIGLGAIILLFKKRKTS